MNASQTVLFREEQRFKLTWLYVFLAAVTGFIVLVTFAADGGRDALKDAVLSVFFIGLAVVLMAAAKMTAEVRDDGVYVRMWPFHRQWRRQAFSDIESAEARTYDPIGEYGGWGIRAGWTPGTKNMAYNMRGNRGVQLTFKDGRRLLIGSQKADELEQAICGAMSR